MGSPDLAFRWRKSSQSGSTGECVELGQPASVWRKSSRSGGNGQCVELGSFGAVRDSKNPTGPVLPVPNLAGFLHAVKSNRFDR